MSYAIQCLQEAIISVGGYVSEINIYNRLMCSPNIIFEAFSELIKKNLLSKEYYENKGHKVLGRFVKGTNSFEIDPNEKKDNYNQAFIITFRQICYLDDGSKYSFKLLEKLFIGSKLAAKEYANQLKRMLKAEDDFEIISYRIKEKIQNYKTNLKQLYNHKECG